MMPNIYKHRLSLDHYHSKFHPFCLANVQKEEKEPYWMENPLPNQEYPKNTMERIQYRSSPSQLTTHTELYPKQTLVVPFWHHEWKSWRSMHDLSIGFTKPSAHPSYYERMPGGEDSKEARSGLLTNGCSKSCDAEGRLSGSTLTHWPMKSCASFDR